MPIENTTKVHGGSATAKALLDLRQTVAAGTSPFHQDETIAQPDTSHTVSCTCCVPPTRFVGTAGKTAEEWAELHRERGPLPKTPRLPEGGAAAAALIRATIIDRIASGELKTGQMVKQVDLCAELHVYAAWCSAAVGQLVAEGALGYVGIGSARRAVVI